MRRVKVTITVHSGQHFWKLYGGCLTFGSDCWIRLISYGNFSHRRRFANLRQANNRSSTIPVTDGPGLMHCCVVNSSRHPIRECNVDDF